MPKKAAVEKAAEKAQEELEQAATQAKLAEELPGGRKPWERLENERLKPWLAFQCYRDLGPKRTLSEVSRQLYGAKDKQPDDPSIKIPRAKSLTRLKAWMVEYNWLSRAVAYDLHLDRTAQEAAEAEVEAMVKRHLGISGMIQQKAVNALKEMSAEQLKKAPKVLLEYLIEGAKMERLARGEVTERIARERADPGSGEVTASAKDALRERLEAIAKRKSEAKAAKEEVKKRLKEEGSALAGEEEKAGLPEPEELGEEFDPAVIALFPGRKAGGAQ